MQGPLAVADHDDPAGVDLGPRGQARERAPAIVDQGAEPRRGFVADLAGPDPAVVEAQDHEASPRERVVQLVAAEVDLAVGDDAVAILGTGAGQEQHARTPAGRGLVGGGGGGRAGGHQLGAELGRARGAAGDLDGDQREVVAGEVAGARDGREELAELLVRERPVDEPVVGHDRGDLQVSERVGVLEREHAGADAGLGVLGIERGQVELDGHEAVALGREPTLADRPDPGSDPEAKHDLADEQRVLGHDPHVRGGGEAELVAEPPDLEAAVGLPGEARDQLGRAQLGVAWRAVVGQPGVQLPARARLIAGLELGDEVPQRPAIGILDRAEAAPAGDRDGGAALVEQRPGPGRRLGAQLRDGGRCGRGQLDRGLGRRGRGRLATAIRQHADQRRAGEPSRPNGA